MTFPVRVFWVLSCLAILTACRGEVTYPVRTACVALPDVSDVPAFLQDVRDFADCESLDYYDSGPIKARMDRGTVQHVGEKPVALYRNGDPIIWIVVAAGDTDLVNITNDIGPHQNALLSFETDMQLSEGAAFSEQLLGHLADKWPIIPPPEDNRPGDITYCVG